MVSGQEKRTLGATTRTTGKNTNHFAEFIDLHQDINYSYVINLTGKENITITAEDTYGNVEVAIDASPDYKSQAHTSGVSLDQRYFYSAASHDGIFYRIDLNTWKVKKTDTVPANLLMGSFIWDADGDEGDYVNPM